MEVEVEEGKAMENWGKMFLIYPTRSMVTAVITSLEKRARAMAAVGTFRQPYRATAGVAGKQTQVEARLARPPYSPIQITIAELHSPAPAACRTGCTVRRCDC